MSRGAAGNYWPRPKEGGLPEEEIKRLVACEYLAQQEGNYFLFSPVERATYIKELCQPPHSITFIIIGEFLITFHLIQPQISVDFQCVFLPNRFFYNRYKSKTLYFFLELLLELDLVFDPFLYIVIFHYILDIL